MTWQDIVVLIIVVTAIIILVMNMVQSFRHKDSCSSCRHGKDNNAKHTSTKCYGTDACAGCPLHDSCHKY